jgi:hypothetical protein
LGDGGLQKLGIYPFDFSGVAEIDSANDVNGVCHEEVTGGTAQVGGIETFDEFVADPRAGEEGQLQGGIIGEA